MWNRFKYIDSKYNAGDSLTDVITLRGYAKSNITVTPYADIYATVKYGSYLVQQRAARNLPVEPVCPLTNVNDTEIYISLRHTSVTYKLKLNGGDVKAVQGDSGHAQVDMVTNVYSHIIDEDRKKNAQLFEEAFYGKKDLDLQLHVQEEERKVAVPEGIDPGVLVKVLANPETAALLASLVKSMGGQ